MKQRGAETEDYYVILFYFILFFHLELTLKGYLIIKINTD